MAFYGVERHRRRPQGFFSSAPRSRRRRSWVLSWPVPRVVSDVYMCTTAWSLLTRSLPSQSSFILPLYVHSLATLTTCASNCSSLVSLILYSSSFVRVATDPRVRLSRRSVLASKRNRIPRIIYQLFCQLFFHIRGNDVSISRIKCQISYLRRIFRFNCSL